MNWKKTGLLAVACVLLCCFLCIPAECKRNDNGVLNPYSKPSLRILSIDGGGVRGIISARILVEIEKRTRKPISELFDFIAGNSTGGLVALGLTMPDAKNNPKYTANDMLQLYIKHSKAIFSCSIWRKISTGNGLWGPKYSRDNLDTILEQLFGNVLLSQTIKPVIISSYSLTQSEPSFWTTYYSRLNPGKDVFLKDVAGATTAAPTYFPPKVIKNKAGDIMYEVDGGIYANNPSSVAYGEIYDNNPKITRQNILLVSIGTGQKKLDKSAKDLKNSGIIGWVIGANLIDVMMNAEDYLCEWESNMQNHNNYRLQIKIPKGLGQMDNASDDNISRLIQEAELYIKENNELIDTLCAKLR